MWYLRRELCALSYYNVCRNRDVSREVAYDLSPGEVKLFCAAIAEHLATLSESRTSERYRESDRFLRGSNQARGFCSMIGIEYRHVLELADLIESHYHGKPVLQSEQNRCLPE